MSEKPLSWLGSSRDDLRAFPDDARQHIGHEIHRLQVGLWPTNCSPLKVVGAGVYEIRVSDDGRAFRTIFVAKFEEAIYILHAFEKKTQQTPRSEIELAKQRYKLMKEARPVAV